MAKGTPATLALEQAGVAFTLHEYAYDPGAGSVGIQAAEAMGVPAATVFKTLMIHADGRPACAVIASDRQVAMKQLAAALGAKSATMMPPADAERLTGYKVGGISPFGHRRRVPTVFDAAASGHEAIYLNGGRRGLQVRLAPAEALRVSGALIAKIAA